MANYDQGIKVINGLSLAAAGPLDTKSTAKTFAERDAFISGNISYKGHKVYVEADGHTYENTGVPPTGSDFSKCWKIWYIDADCDQTISGLKTFTTAPKINNETITTKEYVDAQILGNVGDQIGTTIQAWDKDLDELSKLTGTGHIFRKANGTYTSSTLSTTATDIVATKDTNTGNINFSLANHGTAGNYNEIVVDAKGRVSSGKKHTTVEGFGITNAVRTDNINQNIAGTKTFTSAPKINTETVTTKEYVDTKFRTDVVEQINKTIQAHSDQLDKVAALTDHGYVYRKADGTIQGMTVKAADTTVTVSTDETAKTTTIKLPNTGTAGTYYKVTTDAQGRVISGTNPTTVEGFGITNSVRTDAVNQNIAGIKTFSVAPKIGAETATTKEYVDAKFTSDVTDQIGKTIQAHSDQLDKLAALKDRGLIYRKEDGTIQSMTLKAADSSVSVTVDESLKTASIKLPATGVAGTYFKVTTDAQGRVTSGTNPTTLNDFGIVDGVHKQGDTLTGVLKYSGVPDSAFNDENAIPNVKYVDSVALGYATHEACNLGSTVNLAGTYKDGSNPTYPGAGATYTLDSSVTSINRINLKKGQRILLLAQTDAKQNGVYEVTSTDAPWVLTRADDMDGEPAVKYNGASFLISEGTTGTSDNLKGTVWKIANEGLINFGTDPITFNQAFAPNEYSAGAGISINANVVSANQGTLVKVINGNLDVSSQTGNSGKILVAGADNAAAAWQTLTPTHINGVLPVNKGGTGLSAVASNGLLLGNTAGALKVLPEGSGVLQGGIGTSGPVYAKLQLAGGNVDGILPLTKGGTGRADGKSTALVTPVTIGISGAVTGTATSFDGSANITISATAVDGSKVIGSVPQSLKLTNARTITTSGDVTGSVSFDGSADESLPITLVNSGVVAGEYGDKTATTLDYGSTFNIPSITVDSKGRVTQASSTAIKLPELQTTITGNAGSATKLKTARNFSITGGATANAISFDGTGNVALNVTKVLGTVVTPFTGATTTAAGTVGAVPAPAMGDDAAKFLSADGTWKAVTAEIINTTVPVTKGGTGLTSIANDSILVGTGGSTLKVLPSATGVLRKGTNGLEFAPVPLNGADVTGILPVAKGGTGRSDNKTAGLINPVTISISGAVTGTATSFDGTINISINTTTVDGTKVTVFKGATTDANGSQGSVPAPKVGDNTAKFLSADGTWKTVNAETLGTVVPVNKGGTGSAALTANQLLVGNGTAAIKYVTNTAGVLIGSASGAPVFGKANLTTHVESVLPVANGGTGNANGIAPKATQLSNAVSFSITGGATAAAVSTTGTSNVALNVTSVDGTKTTVMKGATSTAAGTQGTVPAPPAGAQNMCLSGDGTWKVVDGGKVSQSVSTTNANLPILVKNTISTDTVVDTVSFAAPTINPSTGLMTVPGNIKANLSGTADRAVTLSNNRTFSATGDVTAPAVNFNGSANVALTMTLANSGVTSGSYGVAETAVLGWGSTFKVNNITVDAKGRLTNVEEYELTLPNAPSSISGNAGTSTKLQTSRSIDGVNFDGSADITRFVICTTEASIAAKEVSIPGFKLVDGARVSINFNTTSTAVNPTLNVSGTGAYPIKYRNTNANSNNLVAGSIIDLIYNNSNWYIVGESIGNGNYVTQNVTTTNGEYPVIFKFDTNGNTVTNSVRFSTGIKVNPNTNVITATKFKGDLDGNSKTSTSATTLTNSRNIFGVNFNGSANVSRFGICSTANNIIEKVVSIPGFALVTGSEVLVKFTAGSIAANATLNVSGTGAKLIKYLGNPTDASQILVNAVIPFVYDGTDWNVVGALPGSEGYNTVESDNRYAQRNNPTVYGDLNILSQ